MAAKKNVVFGDINQVLYTLDLRPVGIKGDSDRLVVPRHSGGHVFASRYRTRADALGERQPVNLVGQMEIVVVFNGIIKIIESDGDKTVIQRGQFMIVEPGTYQMEALTVDPSALCFFVPWGPEAQVKDEEPPDGWSPPAWLDAPAATAPPTTDTTLTGDEPTEVAPADEEPPGSDPATGG